MYYWKLKSLIKIVLGALIYNSRHEVSLVEGYAAGEGVATSGEGVHGGHVL